MQVLWLLLLCIAPGCPDCHSTLMSAACQCCHFSAETIGRERHWTRCKQLTRGMLPAGVAGGVGGRGWLQMLLGGPGSASLAGKGAGESWHNGAAEVLTEVCWPLRSNSVGAEM